MTTEPDEWWRHAVIYQIYPRSFADANGDGVGDLDGVRSRLPYLHDLGVDAIWLSPFYASPQADAGYDVSDYRRVDPMFGGLDDALGLIEDAHDLGLRVIVDLVPNHCSERHDWFQRARREGPGSAARKRFHFHPGRGDDGALPPNDWQSVFGGPAWTRVPDGEWYLHLFSPQQPDFNWDHPAVHDEFRSILRFWLDRGVDGFRIDVAHGLVKAPGLPDVGVADQLRLLGNQTVPYFDQDGVHEIYRGWRRILSEYDDGRILVAEAWAPTLQRAALYVRRDEMHQAFNFSYLCMDWDAEALRNIINITLGAMGAVGAAPTWVLSNHDVTRHATRFANPPGLGIQMVSPGDRELGLRRARAATILMLGLPGSAYIYQGEELGLPDVTDLPDEVRTDPSFRRENGQDGFRDGCRVPIPWSGTQPPYGFGPSADGPSWLPQPTVWGELSVEAQTGLVGSTLELYRSAIAIRRERAALRCADGFEWLESPAGVLAFRRTVGDPIVVTANTTGQHVRMRLPGCVLLGSAQVQIDATEVVLPPDTTVWWTE